MIELYYITYSLNNRLHDVIRIPSVGMPPTCAICNPNETIRNNPETAEEVHREWSAVSAKAPSREHQWYNYFSFFLYFNSNNVHITKKNVSLYSRAKNLISSVSRSNKIEGYGILKI